jgi:hypothetical protein
VPPAERTGKGIGQTDSIHYLGLSVGPVLRHPKPFWLAVHLRFHPWDLLAFATAYRRLPRNEVHELGTMLDLTGMFYYIVMIVMTLYGLSNISSVDYAWAFVACGMIVGILLSGGN